VAAEVGRPSYGPVVRIEMVKPALTAVRWWDRGRRFGRANQGALGEEQAERCDEGQDLR